MASRYDILSNHNILTWLMLHRPIVEEVEEVEALERGN
jgi:hypothetical protein